MLKQRVVTALALLLLVLGVLFLTGSVGWLVLLTLSAFLAAKEWFLLSFSDPPPKGQMVYASLVAALVAMSPSLAALPLSVWAVTTGVLTAWMGVTVLGYQLSQGQPRPWLLYWHQPASMLTVGVGIVGLFHLSTWLFLNTMGPGLLLLTLFVIWALDVGAFFSGRQWGRRALARYVSPGKTWEGVLGGALLAWGVAFLALTGLQAGLPFESVTERFSVSLGLTAIALLSVFGDLYESVLKRRVQCKDSGQLLPGHGGLLDRIDSLLFALPLMFFYWLWVLV